MKGCFTGTRMQSEVHLFPRPLSSFILPKYSEGSPSSKLAFMDAIAIMMIGRMRWMPIIVLRSKLHPPGIEGTFFALLKSFDNFGLLSSLWIGGLVLHSLNITRTRFDNFLSCCFGTKRIAGHAALSAISDSWEVFLVLRYFQLKSWLQKRAKTSVNESMKLVSLVCSFDG